MKYLGPKCNKITFACVLAACRNKYAKCGRKHEVQKLFNKMHAKNTISWNKMLRRDVNKIFDLMKHLGSNCNNITFACVPLACRIHVYKMWNNKRGPRII